MEDSHLNAKPPAPFEYHFRKYDKPKEHIAVCKRLLIYRFKNSKQVVYMVEVHELEHDLYVIKFYQKKHRDSPKKFSLLTGDHKDVRRIISTCAHIGDDIAKKNPRASFGFMGALKESEEQAGKIDKSSRYRVYKAFCFFFVRRDKYHHIGREGQNLHLLLNKNVYATVEDANKGVKILGDMIDDNYDIEGYLMSRTNISA